MLRLRPIAARIRPRAAIAYGAAGRGRRLSCASVCLRSSRKPGSTPCCARPSWPKSLGFDVLWAHEHHAGAAMYPSPLMTLAALASRTKRIGLGTNMLLLPLYHPLRVAEDGAMVDVMSGGRLRLGVSAGYAESDLRAFAVPPGERVRRMRDGLALIRAVWTGEPVTLENSLSQLTEFKLFPRPLQDPAPPIYVGGTVDAAIRRAARLGDEFLISTTQRIADIPRIHRGVQRRIAPTRQGPVGKIDDVEPHRSCRAGRRLQGRRGRVLFPALPAALRCVGSPERHGASATRRVLRPRSMPSISSLANRPSASTGLRDMPSSACGRSLA